MLDYKHEEITAKRQDEGIASSTYCNYSCHFAGPTHFYFTKAGGKEDGVGGWGLPVTLIDILSFYLPNKFFLSSELRRHSKTTLSYGVSPLAVANV